MKLWIAELFENEDLLRMGHGQRAEDLNLGLGWLYYGFARALRPSTAVVIGSLRGFVPLVLGKALQDNVEDGSVVFIDPSHVDDFWKDPAEVVRHFQKYGVNNVRHFLMTTQQFVQSEAYRNLADVGMVFIDGYHSEEQASFDFEAFEPLLAPDGVVLFHDSMRIRPSRIYGPENVYEHRVKCLMDKFKQDPTLQVFDIPLQDGVTLVQKTPMETEIL